METMQLFYENLAQATPAGEQRPTQTGEISPAPETGYIQCLAQLTQSNLAELTALKTVLGWRAWDWGSNTAG